MKLLDRVFGKVKKKMVSFFTSTINGGTEDWYDALNLNSFKDSLYLFIGVSMIRETVSSIPLEMYRIKNADGDVEEIHDDPLLDLIERPNYRQTQKEFWKLAIAYYLLAGETFWYFERESENSTPTSMVNMRPDHVEVIFSQDKKQVVGYEFTQSDGQIIKLPAEEVLHIKNIDPTNPSRGVGVIRPATQRIVTEREASEYQASVFQNQGRPDIAVFADVDLTDEQAEDARERWNKIYGKDKGSGAGFFGNTVKDIKLLNVSPKEMDFIKSQNFLRDDILAALRIPKSMITSDDVNLANAKTGRVIYQKEACEPVLDAFIDVINNRWFTSKLDEDKFLTYESEVIEDRELLLKEATELKRSGIISQNEARALLNYPDVDGGDIFDEPGSVFQLAMKSARLRKKAKRLLKKRPVLIKKFKAIEATRKMLDAEATLKGVKREQNSVFYTTEMKEAYIRAFNDRIDRRANIFKDTVDVYNEGLLKRIVKQMEDLGINPDNVFDLNTEVREAKGVFVPLMTAMYTKAGQDTMDDIANGFAQKASEHFYTIDQVIQELENRAEFFILSMLDTDFKQLRDIIAQGLADGHGVDKIARSLREYFDNMSVSRARTIARTETGRLISQATDEAYRQSEVVTGKEWLTARDNKVRPLQNPNNAGTVNDHVQNEGKIVAPGGTFPNGERFPGELTINCRCAIAPAV